MTQLAIDVALHLHDAESQPQRIDGPALASAADRALLLHHRSASAPLPITEPKGFAGNSVRHPACALALISSQHLDLQKCGGSRAEPPAPLWPTPDESAVHYSPDANRAVIRSHGPDHNCIGLTQAAIDERDQVQLDLTGNAF